MKKIVLSAVLAVAVCAASDADFKKGFDTAVEAVRLELINGSNTNRYLNFKYDKLLYLNTSKLSTNEILLIQFIAFSNGFTDLGYSNEKLYFGSFSRDADRAAAKSKLESLIGMSIETESNNGKIKEVTPILDRSFYIQKRNVVEGAIKRAEYSYYGDNNNPAAQAPAPVAAPAPVVEHAPAITQVQNTLTQVPNTFLIPLKNGTDVFEFKNGLFRTIGITDMSKVRYESTTNEYVKAYNQNIYFKISDVKFLER